MHFTRTAAVGVLACGVGITMALSGCGTSAGDKSRSDTSGKNSVSATATAPSSAAVVSSEPEAGPAPRPKSAEEAKKAAAKTTGQYFEAMTGLVHDAGKNPERIDPDLMWSGQQQAHTYATNFAKGGGPYGGEITGKIMSAEVTDWATANGGAQFGKVDKQVCIDMSSVKKTGLTGKLPGPTKQNVTVVYDVDSERWVVIFVNGDQVPC